MARGDHWSVDCYRFYGADIKHYEAESFAIIRKNGVELGRFVPQELPEIGAYIVHFDAGYPVFAVRGASGLGSHWDTMIYAIRNGRLIKVGSPPAMNSNGPILWSNNKRLWAFDNFDRYKDMGHELRLARVLMRVDSKGHLRKWKVEPIKHPQIPITIVTPDDLNIPKSGF